MKRTDYIPIPHSPQPRVVIIGGGFGGLRLARKLSRRHYQVVLLDKNNYHQFQPLFYQVAMSGLEPSSIVFPLRKVFQRDKNIFVRSLRVQAVEPEQQRIRTEFGFLDYDHLVLAMGARTNYYGNEKLAHHALPMKSVAEALLLRNRILADLERAVNVYDYEERQSYIDIVVVGGGPTGVEVAGSLAEMKKHILPKDYKELNPLEIDIHLVEGGDQLLGGMSQHASEKAEEFLKGMGVLVRKNTFVTDYDGYTVTMNDDTQIVSRKLIWAAGVQARNLEGIPEAAYHKSGRIRVNEYCQVADLEEVYVIGDQAYLEEEPDFPRGHPQVAQVALQMGAYVARQLNRRAKGKKDPEAFHYKDKGSMATIGRNRAVADLPKLQLSGFPAWIIWLWVHLWSLIGTKNKLFVFVNWVINYFTYDPALRLIIRHKQPPETPGGKEKS